MTSTELVESFQNFTGNMIENFFPEKTVTISDRDKPYMTEDLKLLRRQRMRAYSKGGRCEKYLALLKRFESKMRLKNIIKRYCVKWQRERETTLIVP